MSSHQQCRELILSDELEMWSINFDGALPESGEFKDDVGVDEISEVGNIPPGTIDSKLEEFTIVHSDGQVEEVTVSMGTLYVFRGQALKSLSPYEYFTFIEVISKNVAKLQGVRTRDFDDGYVLTNDYTQKLKDQPSVPLVRPPRYPRGKNVSQATKFEYSSWHAVYMRPWNLEDGVPDITWSAFLRWSAQRRREGCSWTERLQNIGAQVAQIF
eukprot:GHVH01000010.1.p1 GENE.GHVH01000010.1~~GHVH01000010.1.p1  ORF type:complete len:214 (+),score=30.86 GHVH01000010.1:214-855(+)